MTFSPTELEVSRIRELTKNRRHSEALAAAEALLAAIPENVDVLFLLAVNRRYVGRIPAALATLDALERRHPGFSRLYQERGHCYTALRDAPRAIVAFQRAVSINPALAPSWSMLERLHGMTGNAMEATKAAEQIARLKQLAPEVVHAGSLFSDGELAAAEKVLRAFLGNTDATAAAGTDAEAQRLLARVNLRLLLDQQQYAQVREALDGLLKLEPDNVEYLRLYATACAGLGEHETAIELYQRLLKATPASPALPWPPDSIPAAPHPARPLASTAGSPDLLLLLAHSWKTIGHQHEAIACYRAAATAHPSFGDAYWSLANLKTYRFSEDEIARMRLEEAAGPDPTDAAAPTVQDDARPATRDVDRYHLCFALGKALEDRREYAESWRYYERGNALKRAASHYRPEILETNTRQQIEVCTAEFFAARTNSGAVTGTGAPAPTPIFIVGLPRSGSTLIEQILASHSQVEATHELSDIPRIVTELQGSPSDPDNPRYPRMLADLTPEDFRRLGERYLSDTRAYRRGAPDTHSPATAPPDSLAPAHAPAPARRPRPGASRPFFTDKMPNNFRHLGLIHLMLPNAKIIDVRREPMACCFSNLKQLFAGGQEFTYSIDDIARYYRTYLDLMRHWDSALPGRVLHLSYEDVVEDLEGNVRRLLDFCGLQFEPACVDFHKTARSVHTASSEQVRQPLFREGLAQWQHYKPWLGPLEEALGDALTRYRLTP